MSEPLFLRSIDRPTLLLEEQRCKKNIKRMVDKCERLGISFRPHFKTHQSRVVGDWFLELGVRSIAVSSLYMAEYFAAAGWQDITVAVPVNLRAIARIRALASKIRLNLLVESVETVQVLDESLAELSLEVFIKIDAGYGRTGIHYSEFSAIEDLMSKIAAAKHLDLAGFLAHSGQAYYAADKSTVEAVNERANEVHRELKRHFPDMILSSGDTPTASVCDEFAEVSELRPGNFVFYDLDQHVRGVCDVEEISVLMACPVLALHAERKEVIVHGGAVHFCKDSVEDTEGKCFGWTVDWKDGRWDATVNKGRLVRLSQEHGTIHFKKGIPEDLRVGDLLGVLPVHSCMTADSMRVYRSLDGSYLDHAGKPGEAGLC